MEIMLIDEVNKSHIAAWCGGRVDVNILPAVVVPTKVGDIAAIEGDIILKFDNSFVVYTPKMFLKHGN